MEITWLGILAVAILIFTGYGGYRKGFVRDDWVMDNSSSITQAHFSP